jgi:hypothetical protein
VLERLLDEGLVVGGNGQIAAYRGLVILTDNADFEGGRRAGFQASADAATANLMSHLGQRLGRRLLSRVGAPSVIAFAPLEGREVRRDILRLQLSTLGGQLGVEIRAEEAALDTLLAGAQVSLGARDIIRVFREGVESKVLAALAETSEAVGLGVFARGEGVFCRAFTTEELHDAERSSPSE